MIRVAFVVHTFDMGGLERCVARLVNHLPPSDFETCIICLNRNGTAANWLEKEVPIHELHKRAGQDLGVIKHLSTTLRENGIQIVHSHNWGTLVETSIARRRAGTPRHVHAERGMELADRKVKFWKKKLRGWASRWALGRADAVLAVADAVRDDVAQRTGYSSGKIQVVPNGVDPPESQATARQEFRALMGADDQTLVIGSLGRLAPVKDFGTAISMIADLRERGHKCLLALVGEGSQERALREAAEAGKVSESVYFAGRSESPGDWLSAFDVYLNCSLNEGMSQAILEAMASGLPQVVTDVGDNRKLVTGMGPDCGLVVPAGEAQLLADACEKMLAADLRKRFGEQAKRTHEAEFGVQQMTRNYEVLYGKLMANVNSC